VLLREEGTQQESALTRVVVVQGKGRMSTKHDNGRMNGRFRAVAGVVTWLRKLMGRVSSNSYSV